MEMIFHSHANKTHFHKKGCALSLILKARVFGTRKWPNPALHKVDLLPVSPGGGGTAIYGLYRYEPLFSSSLL